MKYFIGGVIATIWSTAVFVGGIFAGAAIMEYGKKSEQKKVYQMPRGPIYGKYHDTVSERDDVRS